MRIKMISGSIAVLISLTGFAQQRMNFQSINMAGLACGESGSYVVLQTVNGFKCKEWFFGGGVGIDYYKNKTIPLFADVRTFLPKTNVFIFGDLGYDFPSHNKPAKETPYIETNDSYTFFGGSYCELGAGYKIRLTKQNSLLLTTGYSYKKLNNKIMMGINDITVSNYNTYKYGYGRILIKAGICF